LRGGGCPVGQITNAVIQTAMRRSGIRFQGTKREEERLRTLQLSYLFDTLHTV
jgi:hypothetical protein